MLGSSDDVLVVLGVVIRSENQKGENEETGFLSFSQGGGGMRGLMREREAKKLGEIN